jgi:hypothetical protein
VPERPPLSAAVTSSSSVDTAGDVRPAGASEHWQSLPTRSRSVTLTEVPFIRELAERQVSVRQNRVLSRVPSEPNADEGGDDVGEELELEDEDGAAESEPDGDSDRKDRDLSDADDEPSMSASFATSPRVQSVKLPSSDTPVSAGHRHPERREPGAAARRSSARARPE